LPITAAKTQIYSVHTTINKEEQETTNRKY